jgi:magnesium chelatase accessory protein
VSAVKPDWSREGADWPNREASRFVLAGGVRWHVQVMGQGPVVLMLHGSGAATHSWRDLAPRLARRYTLVAPDLPGHGFTSTPASASLSVDGMARLVAALTDALGLKPWAAVGHSAGAAVAIRLRRQGVLGDGGIVAINGALRPFPGAAGHIFPTIAKLLFLNPMAVQMFAWRAARPGAIARLMEGTGSHIDARGIELYRRLLSTPGHIAGALGMMANWNLEPLVAELPSLTGPLTLVAAQNDRAVPPDVARAVQASLPSARIVPVDGGLGHLAHEEDPERLATIILGALG